MRKMGDFEAGPQKTIKGGTKLEASRAAKFLSKSSAHRYSRYIGVFSTSFVRKMDDFEAGC